MVNLLSSEIVVSVSQPIGSKIRKPQPCERPRASLGELSGSLGGLQVDVSMESMLQSYCCACLLGQRQTWRRNRLESAELLTRFAVLPVAVICWLDEQKTSTSDIRASRITRALVSLVSSETVFRSFPWNRLKKILEKTTDTLQTQP